MRVLPKNQGCAAEQGLVILAVVAPGSGKVDQSPGMRISVKLY